MQTDITNSDNLQKLAAFDFLDLFLLGETGTGKTHAAQQIHELSPRSQKPFVAVNCAELSPGVIESELFGYEKGAFTGAVTNKAGKFEAAAGGTLFLDEIGELPANLQAKLLKVTEEKCITRVGGNRPRPIDVRIIYATHRDLDVLREDLRYRIAAHAIYLKPLRERRDEIVPLARLFVTDFTRRSGRSFQISDQTLKLLENAEWQGNIRELRTFIEKACLSALFAANAENKMKDPQKTRQEKFIEIADQLILDRLFEHFLEPLTTSGSLIHQELTPFSAGETMEVFFRRIEKHFLKTALDLHQNNQTRAAAHLGISRTGLIKKLKRLGH